MRLSEVNSHELGTPLESVAYRHSWLRLVRPITWSGTIAPVLIGTALAYQHGQIRIMNGIVMLVAAILVQSITNMLNDYFDYQKGQEMDDWELVHLPNAHHHITRHKILGAAFLMVACSVVLGAWLARQAGWSIAVIGAISIAAGYLYSAGKKSLSSLGLGELTAAIFMGPVIVALAMLVQRQPVSPTNLLESGPIALLIGSMILTNNIRDIDKDTGYRRTVPIRVGRRNALLLLTVTLLAAYVWTLCLILYHVFPEGAFVVVLAAPIAVKLRRTAGREEPQVMKWAAYHHWVFGLLLVAALFV